MSDSEDDQSSLERIHTFNLKDDVEPPNSEEKKKDKIEKQKSSVKSLRSLISAKVLNASRSQEK